MEPTEESQASQKMPDIVPIISGKVNVADYLETQATRQPCQRAVIEPVGRDKKTGRNHYSHVTFSQLLDVTNRYAWALDGEGVTFGDRVLVGLKPGINLVAVTFALYKLGAVPVFIDPGMGKTGLLACIKQIKARVVVAEFKAHVLAMIHKSAFATVEKFYNIGTFQFGKIRSLQKLPYSRENFPIVETEGKDLAAILFTSGSTGTAKGVLYTHSIFAHQIKLLRQTYKVTPDDVDMSIFPLFALFAVSMGMPTVIPDMDCSRPLSADPRRVCRIIHDQGVTFSFGSPTFWDKMANFCTKHDVRFPSLRALLMAGCSVPCGLHEKFLDNLLGPDGDIYVPYGATEALPLTSMTGSLTLMGMREKVDGGAGTCVGKPVTDKVDIRIIKITDDPIADWDEGMVLPKGEIGEIAVKGVIVTSEYFERPDANEKSKIREGRYTWHRMGDLGYFDEDGYLWFCGRKADRVNLPEHELYTDCCENVFNTHEMVKRSALVPFINNEGVTEAVIIIQPNNKLNAKDTAVLAKLEKEILELAEANWVTNRIKRVLVKDSFPVDVRHNAKIKRDLLTVWADSLLKN
ncbi:MAG: fatty acid CoA ligase family protein [Lentisphaeraceae bacterium]|nr:fatty acid CoA ligase family protein [Lentisphaeraceae bacterium]